MTMKCRITKLESMLGGKSTKRYLWLRAVYGETKQAAIDRYLQERAITLDDVGYRWLSGVMTSVRVSTIRITCGKKT
jgi:hypothetical protein